MWTLTKKLLIGRTKILFAHYNNLQTMGYITITVTVTVNKYHHRNRAFFSYSLWATSYLPFVIGSAQIVISFLFLLAQMFLIVRVRCGLGWCRNDQFFFLHSSKLSSRFRNMTNHSKIIDFNITKKSDNFCSLVLLPIFKHDKHQGVIWVLLRFCLA